MAVPLDGVETMPGSGQVTELSHIWRYIAFPADVSNLWRPLKMQEWAYKAKQREILYQALMERPLSSTEKMILDVCQNNAITADDVIRQAGGMLSLAYAGLRNKWHYPFLGEVGISKHYHSLYGKVPLLLPNGLPNWRAVAYVGGRFAAWAALGTFFISPLGKYVGALSESQVIAQNPDMVDVRRGLTRLAKLDPAEQRKFVVRVKQAAAHANTGDGGYDSQLDAPTRSPSQDYVPEPSSPDSSPSPQIPQYQANDPKPLSMDEFTGSPSSSPSLSSSPNPASPKESAWERIRRERLSGKAAPSSSSTPPQSWQERAREAAASGAASPQREEPWQKKSDGYTYSSTDEEKQLAKAQAQRDFDAQLDRERQGGASDGWGEDDSKWTKRR